MTLAVCFKCGKTKFGAFLPCPECSARPQTDDEVVLSLAMTDHYFDRNTLEQMGKMVADGTPPSLDPDSRERLLRQLREQRPMIERMLRLSGKEPEGEGIG